jgi:hypothetical protein
LRGASFGDTFNQQFNLDSGGRRTFDYVVNGRVGKIKASGRLSVKATDFDAAGTLTSTCDTGSMTWAASSG